MIKIFFFLLFSILQYTVYAGVVPSATPEYAPKSDDIINNKRIKKKRFLIPLKKLKSEYPKSVKILTNIHFYWHIVYRIWLRFTYFFTLGFNTFIHVIPSDGFLINLLFLNPFSKVFIVISFISLMTLKIILSYKVVAYKEDNRKFYTSWIFGIFLSIIMYFMNYILKWGNYMYSNAIFMGIILIYLLITHLWLFPRWKRKGLI